MTTDTTTESFAPDLANALRVSIMRNPGLSSDLWRQFTELLDRYHAAVGE